jgi:hypothetical protein
MKKRFLFGIVVSCAVLAMLLAPGAAYTQTTSTIGISSYTIVDDDGRDVSDGQLMAGDTYEISFEITVDVDLPDTTLTLETDADKAGGVYWSLDNNYGGVNTDTWQPGLPSIDFSAVKGKAKFALRGMVPSDFTKEVIEQNNEILHFIEDISLVKLSLGSDLITEISAEVTDQAIRDYQRILTDKRNLLQTADMDAKYEQLAQKVVSQAEILSGNGYVQNAKNLLDTLPASESGFPTPLSEESSLPYIVIIAALALILIIFFFLFLKARSNRAFVLQQVDDEAGRLDVLLVRVSKIDKQLAGDIGQVKEQLERLGGR